MEEKTCKTKCDGHKNTLKLLGNNKRAVSPGYLWVLGEVSNQ